MRARVATASTTFVLFIPSILGYPDAFVGKLYTNAIHISDDQFRIHLEFRGPLHNLLKRLFAEKTAFFVLRKGQKCRGSKMSSVFYALDAYGLK